MDLGSGWGAGWEGEKAILLRQRVRGTGLCSRIPSLSLGGGWFGNQDWGLLTTLLPTSFSLPHLTTLAPWEAPKPSFPI